MLIPRRCAAVSAVAAAEYLCAQVYGPALASRTLGGTSPPRTGRPSRAGPAALRRCFGSTRRLYKNPYYFYDLAGQQPTHNYAEVEVQAAGHLMFDPSANASKETMQTRVARVFGDLGSRDASRAVAEAQAVMVLGVRVPPRPEEPTNCCMSGCVNCVWELYKDELGEWKEQVRQATSRLMEPAHLGRAWPWALGREPRERRDARAAAGIPDPVKPADEQRIEAGGGTPVEAEALAEADGGPPSGISQGIEVFIETEKRLKQRQAERAARRRESQAAAAAARSGRDGSGRGGSPGAASPTAEPAL